LPEHDPNLTSNRAKQGKKKTGRSGKPSQLRCDPKRQANESIQGYRYQFLQSVHKWLDLEDDDFLFLEGAEDFDQYTRKGVTTVQVKASPRPLTLNSSTILKSIKNFWNLHQQDEKRVVYFRLIARAPIGIEQGHPFGRKVKGLDLWRQAARDRNKAEELRTYLITSQNLPQDLRTFLQSNDLRKLMSVFFARLAWDTSSPEAVDITDLIKSKLILHGEKNGVPPKRAAKVFSRIIDEVMAVASQKENRWLNRARFLEIFEEETSELVPREQFQRIFQELELFTSLQNKLLAGIPSPAIDAGEISYWNVPPIPRDIDPRTLLVENLKLILEQEGFLCLSGSVGLGKTTLAKLLLKSMGNNWLWLTFSSLEAQSITHNLTRLWEKIQSRSKPKKVVIDDLTVFQAGNRSHEHMLGMIIYTILERGGQIIITSHTNLPDRFFHSFRLSPRCNQKVPCLTREEIEGIAKALSCPKQMANKWAGIIEFYTKGHPQLVHSRMHYLKAKGWPGPTSKDFFKPGPQIEKEREEVRRSLLTFLMPEEKELIYRLSLHGGFFRKDHAIAIGDISEGIPCPGDVFIGLVGPWIEEFGGGYYRLSTLLDMSGNEVWPPTKVKKLRADISTCMLKCHPITTQEVQTVFLLAFTARAQLPLLKLILSILHASKKIQNTVFKSLWWIGSLRYDENKPVFPEDPYTNFMLRLLQFKVVAQENPNKAASIAKKWEQEIDPTQSQESYAIQRYLFSSNVLLRYNVPLTANSAISYLMQLSKFETRLPAEIIRHDRLKPPPGQTWIGNRFDPLADLFFCVLMRCTSPLFFSELLECLNNLPPKVRQRILAALSREPNAYHLVNSVWLGELKSESPDWSKCLEVFEKAFRYAVVWEVEPLLISAANAKAIILDEYLDKKSQALKYVQEVMGKIDSFSKTLNDRKATILLNQGRFFEALEIWRSLLPSWNPPPSEFNYLPIFAFRNAGIAASLIKNWKEAAEIFKEGGNRCTGKGFLNQKAGFIADAGFYFFLAGQHKKAIDSFIEALEFLDQRVAVADENQRFVLSKRIGHTLATVLNRIRQNGKSENFTVPPAYCSDPDIKQKVLELPKTPNEICWLSLAEIECDLDQGSSVFHKVYERLLKSPLLVVRFSCAAVEVKHALKSLSQDGLPKKALLLAHLSQEMTAQRKEGKRILDEPTFASSPSAVILQDASFAINILFGGLVIQAGSDKLNEKTLDLWLEDSKTTSSMGGLISWIKEAKSILWGDVRVAENILKNKTGEGERESRLLGALKVCMEKDVSPDYSFYAEVLLLDFLGQGAWVQELGPSLCSLISRQWLLLVETPAILMSPRLTVPRIRAACEGGEEDINKAARILLAAKNAVNFRLPKELSAHLNKLADDVKTDETANS